MGDRVTGGGLRSLAQRQFKGARAAGDRLTGGGLRALAKRVLPPQLHPALVQPAAKALACGASQPSLPQGKDTSLLVKSLHQSAFGRPADQAAVRQWVDRLQSGTSLESLAEDLVRSPEFQARHGSSPEVDIKYITALYRDGLGRPPELASLAFWLASQDEAVTRAKVLASVAASDEALERTRLPTSPTGIDYKRWVEVFDTIRDADRGVIRAHISALPYRPVISVILWVGRISEAALRESLNSVVRQLYPYWELCITTDALADPYLNTIIRDATAHDLRVQSAVQNTLNGTASAINAGLNSASGEFVAFLRAGDLLPEHALYEAAVALGGNERAEIVYTDVDSITSDGQRNNPWFKPGWDPDLLLGQDYVNNLAVYRRALVESVGALRSGFDGAEFHDLALRTTAATTSDRILHLPAVLYHKRAENKDINSQEALAGIRAINASRRAVRDYLDSRGYRDALVTRTPQISSAIRVVWPLPEPEPLVSVIVPTRDRAELLAQCTEGLLERTDYSSLELLIVDNGSTESATLTLFDRLTSGDSRVRILRHPGPFNYSALNNAAANEAKGEVLLLLNNDVSVIEPSWLRELVSQAVRPDVGIVGAKLIFANESVQHGGVALGPDGFISHIHRSATRNDPGYFGQLALARTLSAVTGACAAIRRAVFFEVGGLDEVNLQVAFNDIDLCLRIGDFGYRVVWTPFAELFHLECASRGKDYADEVQRPRFLRECEHMRNTWGPLLESADPFHNPNTLFFWERFEMPVQPRRREPWRDLGEQMLEFQHDFARPYIRGNDKRAAQTEC
jgi:glycosyltransferase involved in cell wall biosynthesis